MVYPMNGSELIKILRKLGKQRGLTVRIDKKRGRGSHFTLYFGDNRTIMKDRTKEIGSGLLKKLLDNLGLSRDDIR
jgi:mRNA interferase HicA